MIFKWLFIMMYLNAPTATHGCGPTAVGQGRILNFTLSGFHLPPQMVYSEDNTATSIVPTISTSSQNVVTFVKNLIMRSVEDALHQQGRSAGLFDNVISMILQQLTVDVKYNPLKCEKVTTTPMAVFGVANMKYCIVVGDRVTSTCSAAMDMCTLPANANNHKLIESQHLNISGGLRINNIVMANWSNQMWQSVLNRVLRSLTSGPFRSHFYGASVTIN